MKGRKGFIVGVYPDNFADEEEKEYTVYSLESKSHLHFFPHTEEGKKEAEKKCGDLNQKAMNSLMKD